MSLIEELYDKGFQHSADPLYDRAADRLAKLERVLAAAIDFRKNLWCKGEEVIEELDNAIRDAEEK
jgi:hypothetical protein